MSTSKVYASFTNEKGFESSMNFWIDECMKRRGCSYSEAFNAVQRERPELVESHERMRRAVTDGTELTMRHLTPAERFAVKQILGVLARDEVERFAAGVEFSPGALSIARQIVAANLTERDADLLRECAQYARDKIGDPSRVSAGALMVSAGIGDDSPYRALPGGTGATINEGWMIGEGRTAKRG